LAVWENTGKTRQAKKIEKAKNLINFLLELTEKTHIVSI
jgi:hypothetical protein